MDLKKSLEDIDCLCKEVIGKKIFDKDRIIKRECPQGKITIMAIIYDLYEKKLIIEDEYGVKWELDKIKYNDGDKNNGV